MRLPFVLAVLVLGCAGGDDGLESDEGSVGEAESALTQGQVAAMNGAAEGTGITYGLQSPPGLPQTLSLVFAPQSGLRRTSRHQLSSTHVADVIWPPDPCNGASCAPPVVRLGPSNTSWWPPDPCTPPDPCKTHFDIAGTNLRIVGKAGLVASGGFETMFQVVDGNGNVVFDSEAF